MIRNYNLKRKKRVLIITSLFYPEIGANSTRMTSLARRMKSDGHSVTVVTAVPYYTKSLIQEYRRKLIVREVIDGIDIIRTYTFLSNKNNLLFRMLTFISVMISSAIYCIFTPKRYDLIISTSPPFFSLLAALFVSFVRKVELVIDIQDLYPDTAIGLGKLHNPLLISLWRILEVLLYRSATAIVVISDGFKEKIISKGIEARKIFVIESWVDINRFNPDKVLSKKEALGLKDNFVVLFLGNLGYAQKPNYIIETAKLLQDHQEIIFLFVGDGVEKSGLMEKCARFHLDNVIFIPPQPHDLVPSYIKTADVCLVHLAKIKLYEITIPSKTYEYMAMEKPIIMAVHGEASSLIRRHDCGLTLEPEDPKLLEAAILTLANQPQKVKEFGRKARKASVSYSESELTAKYQEIIQNYSTLPR